MKNTWTIDTTTGDLFEDGKRVGSLITGNSGAYQRLLDTANASLIDDQQVVEQQVCNWMIRRFFAIRDAGLPVTNINVNVHQHGHNEKPHTSWGLHACGECVISEPDSITAENALRKDCFGEPQRKAEEKRRQDASLLKEAEDLASMYNAQPA